METLMSNELILESLEHIKMEIAHGEALYDVQLHTLEVVELEIARLKVQMKKTHPSWQPQSL